MNKPNLNAEATKDPSFDQNCYDDGPEFGDGPEFAGWEERAGITDNTEESA